jgi:RimJ/RimL family protein N-acetyltransferase
MTLHLATKRLSLEAASAETLALAAEEDVVTLARSLACRISSDWPPRIDDDGTMTREGFAYVHDLLRKDPSLTGWWGWWVLRRDPERVLIGTVSPKGPPGQDGTVEVSYGIVGSEQGKGYATEATQALIEWVERDPQTRSIVAETFPTLPASIAVMRKCGLVPLGEGSEAGTIRYGRPRTPKG